MSIHDVAVTAKSASIEMAVIDTRTKNQALENIALALQTHKKDIIEANQSDLAQAEQDNLAPPLLKRLKFDDKKINTVCEGIRSLIALADPVGTTLDSTELDQGLELYKVSCPIGVIGVIFESRPDALVQISTLCLKSSNAVMLKGGSEAVRTNRILTQIIAQVTEETGIPTGWIQLIETRQDVADMLALDDSIDLIIPRGSNEFVRYIMDNTRIAVLGHADGICHVYVDGEADLDMATRIVTDSKCQYVAVCNAAETLLVDEKIAARVLTKIKQSLEQQHTELRGCPQTRALIECEPANEQDWKTEYLDYTLSIKVVTGLTQAISHINQYGSGHTDAIVTQNPHTAAQFMDRVDAGNVFWNCSTRFSDGFRYGLGAEVGISTNKLHARGPVGLEGLILYKWKLLGQGQIVADYGDDQGKRFTHTKLHKDCPTLLGE